MNRLFGLVMLALAVVLTGTPAVATQPYITVASTTSTKASGLFDHLLPAFTNKTGIQVRVVAVGTGQAIRLARNGDADVLFVHHKPSEEAFVAEGFGLERVDVMYNDFVVVGPASDPAGIKGTADVAEALAAVARARAPFASRGDESGTHKKERELWQAAGVDVDAASGSWYRETGSGMGATLNAAAGMDAYTLADRGTWISFGNKAGMAVLVEGDERLFNQYGIIAVDPARHPHVKVDMAKTFVDWVTGPEGQEAIGQYQLDGQQLFFPNSSAGS